MRADNAVHEPVVWVVQVPNPQSQACFTAQQPVGNVAQQGDIPTALNL